MVADAPIEDCCKNIVLFGIKKQMVEWGFDKSTIWVDKDNSCILCGLDYMASISIDGKTGKLSMHYGDDWETYLKEGNLEALLEKSQESLTRAKNPSTSKGKGKGKTKIKNKNSSASGTSNW